MLVLVAKNHQTLRSISEFVRASVVMVMLPVWCIESEERGKKKKQKGGTPFTTG
jgi:hypothetical protein